MNYITIVGIIMIAVIIALISFKKEPFKVQFPIATSAIPILVAFLAIGLSVTELDKILVPAVSDMFIKTGFMLIFAMLYFNMISEAGVFDIIVNRIMNSTKGKLNIYIAMVLTVVISSIGMLSAHVVTAYMITFPVMVPLYKKLKLDRRYMMVLTTVSAAFTSFIPWGVAVVTMSAFSGVTPSELSRQALPSALLFVPVFPALIYYFGRLHKKKMGTISIIDEETALDYSEKKVNPNYRPKLFWFNLSILIVVFVILLVFADCPSYIVFILAYSITAVVNYPKISDQNKVNNMVTGQTCQLLIMVLSIAVFIGVFNKTGMSKGFVSLIMSVLPHGLLRYAHIILLLFIVIVLRFLPYQLYLSFLPILINIGKGLGLSPAQIVVGYIPNTALATGSSPMTSSVYVGISLAEIDIEEYVKFAVPIQCVVNAFTIALALITGIYV